MADVTFDQTIEAAVRAVEGAGVDLTGCEMTLLRDLLGRLRLYVARPSALAWPDDTKARLRQALQAAAPYASDTVFVERLDQPPGREFPFAELLRKERKPLNLQLAGFSPVAQWFRFERRFSKDSWLEETGKEQEPWPFKDGPPVVSFYGFKGGVGRTTALAAFALYLSDVNRDVVVIDLDLEAPGIAPLLTANQEPDLGVVDFLLEERIGHNPPLALSRFTQDSPFSRTSASIRVIPAGRLDLNYLEKLGRIDVQGLVQPEHSLRNLLKRLLDRVRSELRPVAILLDVRAGLHDLGGVSLSGLSHLELIFAGEELLSDEHRQFCELLAKRLGLA